MSRVHPTAIVDPGARLADGVEVGPYCVIEPDVEIGAGTRLRESVVIRRYTTLGRDNLVDAFCVLGGEPQDFKFDPETVSRVVIGDGNVFREGVTISRATGPGNMTRVGDKTYWMTQAHAGHEATVEDGAVLVNGAAVAGHGTLGRRAILSAQSAVHQYTWVGEGAMVQGQSTCTMHVPPYCIASGINRVVGLNSVGLRRSPDISVEDRRQLKEAFRLVYRRRLNLTGALAAMDERREWGAAAGRFRDFVRRVLEAEPPYARGLTPHRPR